VRRVCEVAVHLVLLLMGGVMAAVRSRARKPYLVRLGSPCWPSGLWDPSV